MPEEQDAELFVNVAVAMLSLHNNKSLTKTGTKEKETQSVYLFLDTYND